MKKNIAILQGGDSSEIAISIKSAAVVYKHIDIGLYNPYNVHIEGIEWYVIHNGENININKNDFSFLLNGIKINFDGVFIAIHGTPGEDGKLQGYFDLLKIPYNCSGCFEAATTFNKAMCNALLKQFDIPSAKALILNKGQEYKTSEISEQIGLPCFVKPNRAGSSFGISKVTENSQFNNAIKDAFKHDNQVIIESFIDGTEVTCGVIQKEGKLIALPLTEITTENEFFDYQAKYEGKSEEITPARVSEGEKNQVQTLSKEIYKLLNLKGMVRIQSSLFDRSKHHTRTF